MGVTVADAVGLGVKQPEGETLPVRVPLPDGVKLPVPVTVLDGDAVGHDDTLPDADTDALRVNSLLAEARFELATVTSAEKVDASDGAGDGDAPMVSTVALETGVSEKSALKVASLDAATVNRGVGDKAQLALAEGSTLKNAKAEGVTTKDALADTDVKELRDLWLTEERRVTSIE